MSQPKPPPPLPPLLLHPWGRGTARPGRAWHGGEAQGCGVFLTVIECTRTTPESGPAVKAAGACTAFSGSEGASNKSMVLSALCPEPRT